LAARVISIVKHKNMNEPKQKIRLDDLLDEAEPYATFHDATLHKIRVDYEARELTAEFKLCVQTFGVRSQQ